MKRQIVQDELNGIRVPALLHQCTETKNTIQNNWRRINKMIRAKKLERPVVHRIKEKTDDSQTAGHIEHVDQQLRRVAGQSLAKRFAVFAKQGDFTPALAERQKQAQGKGADNQPG